MDNVKNLKELLDILEIEETSELKFDAVYTNTSNLNSPFYSEKMREVYGSPCLYDDSLQNYFVHVVFKGRYFKNSYLFGCSLMQNVENIPGLMELVESEEEDDDEEIQKPLAGRISLFLGMGEVDYTINSLSNRLMSRVKFMESNVKGSKFKGSTAE